METFSALLALCAGNSPVPVNSPHKGQWRGALMFSLICVWMNGWVNNREAGDLRRQRRHYDVIVIVYFIIVLFPQQPWHYGVPGTYWADADSIRLKLACLFSIIKCLFCGIPKKNDCITHRNAPVCKLATNMKYWLSRLHSNSLYLITQFCHFLFQWWRIHMEGLV